MPIIALIDDDRNILTSVSIALEAEGYRIMTYSDGASALEGFKTSPPDLAILDIKMPRMSDDYQDQEANRIANVHSGEPKKRRRGDAERSGSGSRRAIERERVPYREHPCREPWGQVTWAT